MFGSNFFNARHFDAPHFGTHGQIKTYLASVFQVKPVKYWSGSAWVKKPLKRWNGSEWVRTPY